MSYLSTGTRFLAASAFVFFTNTALAETPLSQFGEQQQAERFSGITSLAVSHKDELVYENYFQGADKHTLHNTRSATKTLVAMLSGIAIDNGYLKDQNVPVLPLFKDKFMQNSMDSRKLAITFEDMLTMSSILECDDNNSFSRGHEERMYIVEDWAKFTVNLPVKGYPAWTTKPEDSPYGRSFSYCSAQSALLGIAIERLTKSRLNEFAKKHLLSPLEINQVNWQYTPMGEIGTAGGTEFKSLDLLKLGKLLLKQGKWNGKTVISEEWVKTMLTAHAEPRPNHAYGYQIWRMPFTYNGKDIQVWAMAGNGGNYVFISPELDLVTVITSVNYGQRDGHPKSQKLFQEVVLNSIASAQQ
jgi:CubicO group peptidase (beta-lactamase class C family)